MRRTSPSPARRAELLDQLERWTEWPLTLLAVALVPILLAPQVFAVAPATADRLEAINLLIWGIFALDLVVKVAIAPARWDYLRRHWFDVVLVALPMLRPLRLTRSVRVLRLVRAGHLGAALWRANAGAREVLARHGLHYLLVIALVLVAVSGALMTAFERNQPDATIHDLPDGIWWALATVTTVGYGDVFPRSDAGRGLAVALMLFGIALFGVITANVAAFFVQRETDETLKEVRALREEIQRLLHERVPE